MVPMVESILNEFREEMPATRRVLERIPPDKLAWKPHAKSRSIGELAMHVANIPPWRKELQNLRVLSRPGPAAVCQQRGRDSRRLREKRSHRRGTPQHHDRAIRFGNLSSHFEGESNLQQAARRGIANQPAKPPLSPSWSVVGLAPLAGRGASSGLWTHGGRKPLRITTRGFSSRLLMRWATWWVAFRLCVDLFRCFCLLSSAVSPPSGLVAGHFVHS